MARKHRPLIGARLLAAGAVTAVGVRYFAASKGDQERAEAHDAADRAFEALDEGKHIAARIREFGQRKSAATVTEPCKQDA